VVAVRSRTVRNDRDIVRSSHSGDLEQLGQTSEPESRNQTREPDQHTSSDG
jgi:hypothetical protein